MKFCSSFVLVNLAFLLSFSDANSAAPCPREMDALREIFPSQVTLQEQNGFSERAQRLGQKIKERYRLPNVTAAQDVIWKRFGELLDKESLAEALQALDTLTPAQKSHFLKWAAKNKNLKNTLIAAAYDVGPQLSVDLISHFSGLPIPNVGYLLRTPELHFFEPTAQELSVAWEGGLDKLKSGLVARYQNRAMGELYYLYIRKRVAEAGMLFGAYYLYENRDSVILNFKLARFLVDMLKPSRTQKRDLVLAHQTETANALRAEFSAHREKVSPEIIWVVTRETLRLSESDIFGPETKEGSVPKKVESARAPSDDFVLEAGTLALTRLKKEAKPAEQGYYFHESLSYMNWARDYVTDKIEFQRSLSPKMDEEQIWSVALKASQSQPEAELMIEETYRDSVTKNSPRARKFKQIFLRNKRPSPN